jgi:CheY-like chemotaxis protein
LIVEALSEINFHLFFFRAGEAMGHGKTILIIDSDPSVIEFCRLVLEPRGYRILGAADAADGKRLALAESPDMIVLDFGAGEMAPGVGAATWLACALPLVPVMLVASADGNGAMDADASAEPAAVHLRKPLSHRTLVENVRALTGPQRPSTV